MFATKILYKLIHVFLASAVLFPYVNCLYNLIYQLSYIHPLSLFINFIAPIPDIAFSDTSD